MPDLSRRNPSNAPNQVRTRAAPPPTTSGGGVRRNLFQSQLTRRPTPSSASTSTETLRLDSCVDVLSDSDEIVVRDKQGELEVGEAVALVVAGEEEEEDGVVDEGAEMEKERRRLAEAVKLYQLNHNAVADQTEVLLESVKASLRAKVVALSDDNWMFEAEPHTRH